MIGPANTFKIAMIKAIKSILCAMLIKYDDIIIYVKLKIVKIVLRSQKQKIPVPGIEPEPPG